KAARRTSSWRATCRSARPSDAATPRQAPRGSGASVHPGRSAAARLRGNWSPLARRTYPPPAPRREPVFAAVHPAWRLRIVTPRIHHRVDAGPQLLGQGERTRLGHQDPGDEAIAENTGHEARNRKARIETAGDDVDRADRP